VAIFLLGCYASGRQTCSGQEAYVATLTIRNLSVDLLSRIRKAATSHRRSIGQEVRELLEERYGDRSRVLASIRKRLKALPGPSAKEIDRWIAEGRKRRRTRFNTSQC
jgi:plasmid stability protein